MDEDEKRNCVKWNEGPIFFPKYGSNAWPKLQLCIVVRMADFYTPQIYDSKMKHKK